MKLYKYLSIVLVKFAFSSFSLLSHSSENQARHDRLARRDGKVSKSYEEPRDSLQFITTLPLVGGNESSGEWRDRKF